MQVPQPIFVTFVGVGGRDANIQVWVDDGRLALGDVCAFAATASGCTLLLSLSILDLAAVCLRLKPVHVVRLQLVQLVDDQSRLFEVLLLGVPEFGVLQELPGFFIFCISSPWS